MISYTSDHPRAAPPLVMMMMMEDEVGRCTITASVDSGDGIERAPILLSLSVAPVDGVTTVVLGSSVEVEVKFMDSPFEYTVASIDDHDVTHVADDFADVPCAHRTFAYDRIVRATLDLSLMITAVLDTVNGIVQVVSTLIINVLPNYNIGKTALLEQLLCQEP